MTETRENLTIPPDDAARGSASADLLSHVLAQVLLTGDGVYADAVTAGGQVILDPNIAHAFIVTEGACRCADPDDLHPVLIAPGDLILLPHGLGDAQLSASQDAKFVVCRFWFDPYSLRGMISSLPQLIHIPHAEGKGWLEGILHFLMIETTDTQPGAALMISKIIDVLIIRTLRTWVHLGPSTGWLGGLADARIARALKVLHQEPLQMWSVEELADVAGMSRSSFAERFTQLVGLSPLRYQNEWRLNLARDMLARGEARVGEIGLRIGYESEAAFSRAFKALFGHSPRDESVCSTGSNSDG
jgi:AraC-like DNA-binding protein